MTRPLQEAKMFYKNGWYQPLTSYDFSDFPKNALSVVTFGTKTYVVPIVTEWQVLYYRIDLLKKAGVKVPSTFAELESAAAKLNSADVAGIASRGSRRCPRTPTRRRGSTARARLRSSGT